MKNKFLVMAVITSMLALVVLPSAFAATSSTPEVSADIGTVDLTLTGNGAYTGTGVTLRSQASSTGLLSSPLAETTTFFNSSKSNDYVRMRDGTATAGATMQMFMTSTAGNNGDFRYSGTAGASPADDIAVANFSMCPKHTGSAEQTATVGTYSSGVFTDTINILTSGTTPAARDTSTYTIEASFTGGASKCKPLGGGIANKFDFVDASSDSLYHILAQIDRLELVVPASSPAGKYISTLFILAVDG